MKLSTAGITLIAGFEGLRMTAYQDQRGIWTIGYGHTLGVSAGETCTEEQANNWMGEDLEVTEDAVTRMVTVPINQNQFDALVSLGYNIGITALKNSHLMAYLNASAVKAASAEFLAWNHVNGVVDAGLTRRRESERALFDTAM